LFSNWQARQGGVQLKNPLFMPPDRGADGPELWFKLPLKTMTRAERLLGEVQCSTVGTG